MNDFKVSLYEHPFDVRLNEPSLNMIDSFIANKSRTISKQEFDAFAKAVGDHGYVFCPATFRGGIKSRDSFEQVQLLPLYFDTREVNVEDILAQAERYGLSVYFAYDTFSRKNNSRFTVVFLNDVSIHQLKVAEIMMKALTVIFPEAEPKSTDITGLRMGGNKLLYHNTRTPVINVYSLIMNMCLYLRGCYGDNYRREVYNFSARTGLQLTDRRMLDVTVVESPNESLVPMVSTVSQVESFSPSSNIYIIENGDKSSMVVPVSRLNGVTGVTYLPRVYLLSSSNSTNGQLTTGLRTHLDYRSTILGDLTADCQLYREFSGGTRLNENEIFGLATNLIHVETGSTRFTAIVRQHGYYEGNKFKYDNWEFYLGYLKKTDYQPSPCDRYCRYCDQCQHARDALSTIKPKQRTITRLSNNETNHLCSADEAAELFSNNLEVAISSNDGYLHILREDVGTGKSTAVLNSMAAHPQRRYLVALPTNELKNAHYNKAIRMSIKATRSPSLLEIQNILPPKVRENINYLYQTGKPRAVLDYIEKVIATDDTDTVVRKTLITYKDDMAAFYASKCNAFTTHSRLFTLDRRFLKCFDAVIIDEDPVPGLLSNQREIPLSKLAKLQEGAGQGSPLNKKVEAAIKSAKREPFFTLSKITYNKNYEAISIGVDIASFCLAEKFYFKKKAEENSLWESNLDEDSIVFIKPFRLDLGVKYIILSATVNRIICNYCFFSTHRIKYYDGKKVKPVGTLNQYSEFTMSRAYLDQHPGLREDIVKLSGFDDVISFKKYNLGKYHFGKTTGVNTLTGRNITVLGTPHQPPWLYKLLAYTVGLLGFDPNARLSNQLVKYNDFIFWFMTFDKANDELRRIQFWIIESELVQAIGRARLTRKDCTVNVFSNFPLRQAVQKKLPVSILDKYAKDKDENSPEIPKAVKTA